MTPPIRPASAADIDRLVEIEEAVFVGDGLERRAFRHAVRSPTIVSLVAGAPGTVDGYVLAERRRGSGVARLTSLAVAPEAAGRGIGRALTEAVEAAMRAAGCARMRLEVRADNNRARRLYEAAGYVRFATVADYYEDGVDAERLEKAL